MNINFIDFLKENDKIEIPIIQRDYAQGREDAKTESIRKTFVSELVKAIDDKRTLHLDFIYGSTTKIDNKTVFYPLDGQQRLTTLFLLHWYLYVRTTEEKSEKKEILSKFSYETRTSSRDFTNKLVNKEFDIRPIAIEEDKNGKDVKVNILSDQIANQSWFFLAWKKDPTIKGMLNMLDEIHCVYSDSYKDKINEHFNNLFAESPISFDYLNMGEFSLSDDLYVKMNARGKQLTEFENFKAWLGKHIEDNKIQVKKIENKSWSELIDTKWTDLFWKYKDGANFLVDEEFMRFFRNMAQIYYAVDNDNKIENYQNNIREIAFNKDKETKEYTFLANSFYEKNNIFIKKENDKIIKENISELFSILDLLSWYDNEFGFQKSLKEIFPKNMFWGEKSIFEIFIKFFEGNITYYDKVLFYAFALFLLKNKDSKTNFLIEKLKQWMRVIRNLAYNTEFTVENFGNAISYLKELVKHSDNINKYLATAKSDFWFNNYQAKEENLKAKLIFNNESNEWEKELLDAENHPLLRGQITFLLNKINEEDNNLSNIKNVDLKFFINNRSLAQKMWNKERANNFNNKQLLIRALLSMNFPIQRETDLSNNKESWKKLFRDIDYQKSILKLFSKINNNLIEEGLKNIIEKYPGYTNSENDCRSFLIKDDNLLKNKPYIWYWCKDKAELRSFRTARADYNRIFIFPSRSEIFNKIAKEMNVEVQENKERLFVEIENKICIEQYFWWEDIRYGFRIKINSPEKNKNEYWKGGFKEIEITNSGVTLFCKNIRAMLAQNKFI